MCYVSFYNDVKGNWYNQNHNLVLKIKIENQRANDPVNAHLISGHTVSTKTSNIGQGQPRVNIHINFVELDSPMLHAKFQDHRPSGS